jgi:2-phosphosulfolactate phosphatase
MILSHAIHVLPRKEDLDTTRLAGKVVIVLDILFATTTMVAALAAGARAIVPVLNEAAAREEGARLAALSGPDGRRPDVLLAGELDAKTLGGFAPPTPIRLLAHGVAGKTIVHTTTNGTVAMRGTEGADAVYAGALVNGEALVDHVLAAHPDQELLIVCSGSTGNFNLEDFTGAGYLVELLARRLGDAADWSDAARAARAVFRSAPPERLLQESRVGCMVERLGWTDETLYSARLSSHTLVPRLQDGQLVPAT